MRPPRSLARSQPVLGLALALAASSVCRDDGGGSDEGSSASSESSGEGDCDPASAAIGPMPLDEPGEACCTRKPGCTGYDSMGQLPQAGYLGETLACEDGRWVLDPAYCEGTCPEGREYIGCFWNSEQGDFVRPVCACQ